MTGLTVGTLRRELAKRLAAAFGDDPDRTADLDAKLLLAHALGAKPSALTLREHEAVPADAAILAEGYVDRRVAGEPVARILGEKEFWGLRFRLSPATLVPRPDTETLVSVALERIDAAGRRNDALRLLDLGTGSGCILLALLSELPNTEGLGVDLSAEAIATAAANAEALGLSARARFAAGDWADGIEGKFTGILSNPPYIEDAVLPQLPVEVLEHDPRLALAGGPDGLDPYRTIVPALPGLLARDGFAVLEFGPGQGAVIAALAHEAGMTTEIRRDLGGRERAALLRPAGEA